MLMDYYDLIKESYHDKVASYQGKRDYWPSVYGIFSFWLMEGHHSFILFDIFRSSFKHTEEEFLVHFFVVKVTIILCVGMLQNLCSRVKLIGELFINITAMR